MNQLIMEDLYIAATNRTLEIRCEKGVIDLSGRSILNDPNSFFNPIEEWIKNYIKSPEPKTIINCNFEYIDTASFKRIYNILKEFEKINKEYSVIINWHIENDDPEIMELGNILDNRISLEFNFIQAW